MKPGDFVICIDNIGAHNLVVGKKYKLLSNNYGDKVTIEMTGGLQSLPLSFYAYRFRPFNRKEKLERILKNA
jgi:hypothetical protein